VAYLNRVARDFRVEFPQKQFCKSARRHARRGFASGGSSHPAGMQILAGSQKSTTTMRLYSERASARETAARVRRALLQNCFCGNSTRKSRATRIQIGHVRLEKPATWKKIQAVSADWISPLRCIDAAVQEK